MLSMSSLRESPVGPDPLRKKKPGETQPSPAPNEPSAPQQSQPAAPAPSQTFSQLQSQGIARPAPPMMPSGGSDLTSMLQQQLGISLSPAPGFGGGVLAPDGTRPISPPPLLPPTTPDVGGLPAGGPTPIRPPTPSPGTPIQPPMQPPLQPPLLPPIGGVPQPPSPISPDSPNGGGPTPTTPPGPGGGTPTLPPINGGGTGTNGSPLDPAVLQSIMGWLTDPQKYSPQAFNSDVERAYNGIDDEYQLSQKSLADNLASRGLGTAGDSSIGLGRLSDLNVGRKSAKESVLSSLASDREKRFSSDLNSAIQAALGYNQQLYGHDYLGKQLGVQQLGNVLQALVQSGGIDPSLLPQLQAVMDALGYGGVNG